MTAALEGTYWSLVVVHLYFSLVAWHACFASCFLKNNLQNHRHHSYSTYWWPQFHKRDVFFKCLGNMLLNLSIKTAYSILHASGWRCEVCDLQENLWMNLTDGKVLCGRRYFDGSGGNNHALLHFQETGYPLAVKLGTITPDGAGKEMAQ